MNYAKKFALMLSGLALSVGLMGAAQAYSWSSHTETVTNSYSTSYGGGWGWHPRPWGSRWHRWHHRDGDYYHDDANALLGVGLLAAGIGAVAVATAANQPRTVVYQAPPQRSINHVEHYCHDEKRHGQWFEVCKNVTYYN